MQRALKSLFLALMIASALIACGGEDEEGGTTVATLTLQGGLFTFDRLTTCEVDWPDRLTVVAEGEAPAGQPFEIRATRTTISEGDQITTTDEVLVIDQSMNTPLDFWRATHTGPEGGPYRDIYDTEVSALIFTQTEQGLSGQTDFARIVDGEISMDLGPGEFEIRCPAE